MLDRTRDPALGSLTQLNLIDALARSSEYNRASRLLLQSGLREAFAAEPLNLLKLRWVEGKIYAGLGRPATVVRPLTRGYRVPGEVLDFANRLLPLIAPDLPPATAVRSEPGSLTVRPVSALAGPLVEVLTGLRYRAPEPWSP